VIKVDCIIRKKTEYRRVEFAAAPEDFCTRFRHVHRKQGRSDHVKITLGEGLTF